MHKVIRPISPQEADIIRRTLDVGATRQISPELIDSIASLQVTALCKCGCKTVWFGPEGDAVAGTLLAESYANPQNAPLQIIVWSAQGAIVGLEFVAPEPENMALPVPEEINGHAA